MVPSIFARESRAKKFLETAPMAINTLCARDLGQMTRNGAQCLGIDFVLVNKWLAEQGGCVS